MSQPIGIKLSFETASSRSATGVVGLHIPRFIERILQR